MKEHIEKKTCEYENLQKQTVQLKTAIQEKEIEIEGLKEDIANIKCQDECLKEKINAMEAKEADLEMELDQMKTRCVSNLSKVEKILKGSLDLIPSPSPSVKIDIMGGKVCLRCKGKTLLGDVNKLFVFKSLLQRPAMFLPLHRSNPDYLLKSFLLY